MAYTVASAAINVPRDAHYVLANDAITYRTLLLEGQSTNLCLQSEDLGTTWTVSGTPTRTAAAIPASVMGVALDLIGDDDGAVGERYNQNFSFTADAVKAFSIFVKEGSAPPPGTVLVVSDTVAVANRLNATITWVAGVPSVAMTTGTYLGYIGYANGVYRLLFATTSVTAANNHQVQIYIAGTTPANTGNIYAGGVQAENSPVPTSYAKTTTGTVTRSADSLYFPATDAPQEQTIFIKMVELGTVRLGSSQGVFSVGNATSTGVRIQVHRTGADLYQLFHNVAAAVSSNTTVTPAQRDAVELRCVLFPDGAVQVHQSLNAAAEASGIKSGANALAAAWGDTRFYLNSLGDTASKGINAFISAKRLRGQKTLAECRAA